MPSTDDSCKQEANWLKAVVATEHTLLVLVWSMLTTRAVHDDPVPDYVTRRNPQRAKNQAIHQLQALGYDVTLEPRGAA